MSAVGMKLKTAYGSSTVCYMPYYMFIGKCMFLAFCIVSN